jgi:hypothetical protein
MSEPLTDLQTDLEATRSLYQELLRVVETESTALRQAGAPALFEGFTARRRMLPNLEDSAARLRRHRSDWARLPAEVRAAHREIASLLRQCQDLILRVLMLDRENEQALLRTGLLGPRHLPSHNVQRPHFVAELYRRQGSA